MDSSSSMNNFSISEYYPELEKHTSELLKKSDKKIQRIKKKEKKWNMAFNKNLPDITLSIAKQILDATCKGFSDTMVEPKMVDYRFYSKNLADVSTTIEYYNLEKIAPFSDWNVDITKKFNKIMKDQHKIFSKDWDDSSSEEVHFMMPSSVNMEEDLTLHTRQFFRGLFETLAINVNLVVATQIAKINDKYKSRFIIIQNLVLNEDHDYHITISIKPPASESSTAESISESSADE